VIRLCQAADHEGDREIGHVFDAMELRYEARRIKDQRGRRFKQLVSPICTTCVARLFADDAATTTATLFEED
jgi:hypothetical protein